MTEWTILFDFAKELRNIFSYNEDLNKLLNNKSNKGHTHPENWFIPNDLKKITTWEI